MEVSTGRASELLLGADAVMVADSEAATAARALRRAVLLAFAVLLVLLCGTAESGGAAVATSWSGGAGDVAGDGPTSVAELARAFRELARFLPAAAGAGGVLAAWALAMMGTVGPGAGSVSVGASAAWLLLRRAACKATAMRQPDCCESRMELFVPRRCAWVAPCTDASPLPPRHMRELLRPLLVLQAQDGACGTACMVAGAVKLVCLSMCALAGA